MDRILADDWHDDLFDKLASGRVHGNPFPVEETHSLLQHTNALLGTDSEPRQGDQRQPVRVRLLQALLREAGDPDWKGMEWFAKGIRIGVGERLPRTPAAAVGSTLGFLVILPLRRRAPRPTLRLRCVGVVGIQQ